jgi:hypothetical protein
LSVPALISAGNIDPDAGHSRRKNTTAKKVLKKPGFLTGSHSIYCRICTNATDIWNPELKIRQVIFLPEKPFLVLNVKSENIYHGKSRFRKVKKSGRCKAFTGA